MELWQKLLGSKCGINGGVGLVGLMLQGLRWWMHGGVFGHSWGVWLSSVHVGVWRTWSVWQRGVALLGGQSNVRATHCPILLSILKNSEFSYNSINFETISANPFPNSTLKSLHPFHWGVIPSHNPINSYPLFNPYPLQYPFSQPLHLLAIYKKPGFI